MKAKNIASEAKIEIKDLSKAVHHYDKYKNDYPKHLPKTINFFLDDTSDELFAEAKLACVHSKTVSKFYMLNFSI